MQITNSFNLGSPILTQNDYRLFWVFGHNNLALKEGLVNFWSDNNAIGDSVEAWRRTSEIACVILNLQNNIIAVSSVYQASFDNKVTHFWLYRTFVGLKHRKNFYTHKAPLILITSTFDNLAKLPQRKDSPLGLVIIVENIKLNRPALVAIIQGLGFSRINILNEHKVTWRKYF